MSASSDDKRAAPRYTVIMDAQVTDLLARTTMKLRNSDISLTGCYIDALNPMESGTPVALRMVHDAQVFEAKGIVAYTVPRLGMGITFDQPLSPEQSAVLSRWIAEAAEAAAAAAKGRSSGTRASG